jgi:PAS domain S-box-containing protein
MLESREFRNSKRSQQFLHHVVDCALGGDVLALKETNIGSVLFGRDPGYDTGSDPSVRVRANDVRKRLLAYYQGAGSKDPVRIELSAGSYLPRFYDAQSVPPVQPPRTETGQQLTARPFVRMMETNLGQLQRLAAALHISDHTPWAHRNEPGAVSAEFLCPLLARLAEAMGGDCVYVGALTAEDAITVKTVAVVAGGKIAENFEYPLAGSPCEKMAGGTASIYPRDVQRQFPDSRILRERNAESYAGAPLFDCRGEALGLLVVLSTRPLMDTQLAKSLLDVYAARVAGELERKIAEHALYESERRYQALFESAGDAILVMRGERFVDCNPKALQLFGCTREQLVGQTPFAFSPPGQADGSDSREAGLQRIERALRGEVDSFDWRCQRLDGSVFEAQITLTRLDETESQHLLAHVRDVTHSREAERKMRESEARFRGIFGSAGIGMAVVDMRGRLIESNPALRTMLGYSESELAGMAFADFTHPGDVDADVHLFTELMQGKRESYQIEKRYLRKDGQIVWGMLTASLVRSPNGEPQDCLGMAEDITGRKRAEAARRESEERFRILFECAPDGYYLLDLNGVFRDGNRAAEQLVGYRREEIIGKTLQEAGLLSAGELEKAVRLLAGCARGDAVDEEFQLVRKDGGTVDVEIRALPIDTADGKAVLGAVRDITGRKRVEQALRESEEASRTIIETAPDGVYIVAETGQIVEVNEAACRQVGYSREHLLQSRLCDIVAPRLAESAARRLQERASGMFETAHLRADGTEVPLELSVRYLIFRGQPAWLAIARDITERKQAEKEHASLKQQLERAQKLESVGRLAGGVAHDFNNLLTVINGYSDLVLNELREGDPLRDHVEEVRKAGERAAGLTRQLLAFSRQQIVEPRPLNLNAIVADSGNMLRRLLGEDVELVTDLDPSLGVVMADLGQVHQVLMNLAVNARDAMPHGGTLTVKTANAELDESFAAGHPGIIPGRFAMLAVTDTGTGIGEEIQGHIFDPFFTTKPEGEGTGLGLSTVYGIVRQCGGAIAVTSEPGRGAAFQVYLPRTDATVGIADVPSPSAAKLRGSETILVVEDQEPVRRFTVRVLKNYGYRILEAAQAGEAMLLAERYSGPIHLMLTDVVMPLSTGRELAERLRPLRPHMRVLYMSGHAAEYISHGELLDPGGVVHRQTVRARRLGGQSARSSRRGPAGGERSGRRR